MSPAAKSHLVDLLFYSMFDPSELNALAEHLNWSTRDATHYRIPTNDTVKRGDFGEVLVAAMLDQFHDYELPVQKLRRKLIGNQTLPGTDVLALRVDGAGSIQEVCFVESKVRTSSTDYNVGVQGCQQLREDYNSETPAILPFTLLELRKRGTGDRLFLAFRAYLADRADNRHLDTFRLGLCCEETVWREKILENLEEDLVALNKLCVHVVQVTNLRPLTDELFEALGIHEISDDE